MDPAAENIRKCVGLDRRASHRTCDESRSVWRDVDRQHRGGGEDTGGKSSELEFSFAHRPVERRGPGSLGRAESAATRLPRAIAPAPAGSASSLPGEYLVRPV